MISANNGKQKKITVRKNNKKLLGLKHQYRITKFKLNLKNSILKIIAEMNQKKKKILIVSNNIKLIVLKNNQKFHSLRIIFNNKLINHNQQLIIYRNISIEKVTIAIIIQSLKIV